MAAAATLDSSCSIIEYYGFRLNPCSFEWNWTLNSEESLVFHFGVCLLYATSVWLLQFWVGREKNFKPPAFLETVRYWHNVLLSVVSLWMTVVVIREMVFDGRFTDFRSMACRNTENKGWMGIVTLVYLATKVWEWADTYFLVLSNKPVIFLHFFHHMTTFTMAAVTYNFPVGGFCFVNCAVHFVMYLHYSYPVKWARPFITSGQLLQFVTVISIHTYGYLNPATCFDMSPVLREWWFCQSVVVGYFILFVNFFVQQYVRVDSKASKKVKQQ